jgi:F-type H+-transporting ATPase subunit delta
MSRIARRYARALFKVTEGSLGKAKEDLASLETLQALFDDKDAGKILRSPVMPTDLKTTLLQYGLEKAGADEHLKSFIDAVVSAGRVAFLPAMTEAFRDLIDEKEGRAHAHVVVATDLCAEDEASIGNQLGKLLGKTIIVDTKIDPSLLGGFVARVGNYRIDMSLKTKLDGLAQSAVQDNIR